MGMLTNEAQSVTRITVTLVENGQDVRVVGGIAAVGQNTFGSQRVVELTGKGYPQLQQELEQIADRAQAANE